MTTIGWIQILLYCAIIVAITPVLGAYMTRVFKGERTFLTPILRPVELVLYRMAGIEEKIEQRWLAYTVGMLLFHVGAFLLLYLLMRFQAALPFNPAEMSAVAPDLSFNTSVSFITNTNWQNYGGESTMSYLVQMLGLTHQNFLSAATGIVLAVALIRGFVRASARTVGNFWVDLTRCTLYILLPICVVFALVLVALGMPQTLGPYVEATTLEGAKQTIAVGPVASDLAATGIVLAVALIRGFVRASARTVGNFWVDLTRCTLYILLPICVVFALVLVALGMPQTLGPYVEATTLEGAKQTIAVGPVA